jgi:hypothetical protein
MQHVVFPQASSFQSNAFTVGAAKVWNCHGLHVSNPNRDIKDIILRRRRKRERKKAAQAPSSLELPLNGILKLNHGQDNSKVIPMSLVTPRGLNEGFLLGIRGRFAQTG